MSSHYGSSTVKRPRRTNAELAALDDVIVAAVEDEWPVSLRGVYYRVVSAGAIDKTENAYRVVGRRLLVLRRSGRIGYDRITDGTRWVIRPTTHSDLESALRDTASLYRRSLWRNQEVAVHVFTEKDAITGVVHQVTSKWDVPLGVLRGYSSESFAWEMAEAIKASGKPTIVYQLGDHDPSGVGAWQDFQRKVRAFAPAVSMEFSRLAVTPEQIQTLNLPTRPTKKSDTRAANFDGESVEVDAVPASILRSILDRAIEQHIDPIALERTKIYERSERSLLWNLADRGGEIR